MDMDEYQVEAYRTAVYPKVHRFSYPVTMIASEAGELAGKYSKLLRGDVEGGSVSVVDRVMLGQGVDHEEMKRRDLILMEMGDVLWGLAALAHEMGVSLSNVAYMNLNKLQERSDRDSLRGDGDER